MASTLNVNSIGHSGGTAGLGINSNGVVTRNVLPAWNLNIPDDYSGSTADAVVHINDWGTNNHGKSSQQVNKTCFLQGGCTLSTGIVTVPVTGLYNISTHLRLASIGAGQYMHTQISINNETDAPTLTIFGGGELIDTTPYTTTNYFDYLGARANLIANLNANDNVRVMVYVQTDDAWTVIANHTMFKGYLIG